MPSDFPSAEQERQMLRDVAAMESLDGGTEWELSMCCHAKALLSAIAELRAERDRLQSFLRSFLNPEERGHAVPAHVRDDVRELLGMPKVEG